MSSPVESKEKLSYRDFVKEFMATVDKVRYPTGKERMSKCAEAWRKITGKAEPAEKQAAKRAAEGEETDEDVATQPDTDGAVASAVSKQSGGVTKKSKRDAIIFPTAPTTLREVANLFTGLHGPDKPQTFTRSATFVIPGTHKAQRALRGAVKRFQSDIKHGHVLSAEKAFTQGFNAFLDLARG